MGSRTTIGGRHVSQDDVSCEMARYHDLPTFMVILGVELISPLASWASAKTHHIMGGDPSFGAMPKHKGGSVLLLYHALSFDVSLSRGAVQPFTSQS